jgi:methyl-accepting chemotaxis protein
VPSALYSRPCYARVKALHGLLKLCLMTQQTASCPAPAIYISCDRALFWLSSATALLSILSVVYVYRSFKQQMKELLQQFEHQANGLGDHALQGMNELTDKLVQEMDRLGDKVGTDAADIKRATDEAVQRMNEIVETIQSTAQRVEHMYAMLRGG